MSELTQEKINEAYEAARHGNFKVVLTHKSNNEQDVHYYNREGSDQRGYGYIPVRTRGKTKPKICLVRCPACRRENYAMNVLSGKCTWCPFDANRDIIRIPSVSELQGDQL